MLRLKPTAGYEKRFISALKLISAQTEGSPGCLESSLFQVSDECDLFCYFERWASDEDLKRHIKTENYKRLLSLIEASADIPELDYYRVLDYAGVGTRQ